MNSNDIEPEQVVHTHWTSRRGSWPRGFDLIPVLTPEYLLPSQWIPVLPPIYSLPLRSDCTKVWNRIYPTRDAPFLGSGRRSLIVLMCEQKSYPVWFSCGRKSNPVLCEHSLRSSNWLIIPFDGLRKSFCFVLFCVFFTASRSSSTVNPDLNTLVAAVTFGKGKCKINVEVVLKLSGILAGNYREAITGKFFERTNVVAQSQFKVWSSKIRLVCWLT